jgi:hypothetical protein
MFKFLFKCYYNLLKSTYLILCLTVVIVLILTINFWDNIKVKESQLKLLRATKVNQLAQVKNKHILEKIPTTDLLQIPNKNALQLLTNVLDTHSKANQVVLHQVQFDESTEVKAAKDFVVNKQKIQLDASGKYSGIKQFISQILQTYPNAVVENISLNQKTGTQNRNSEISLNKENGSQVAIALASNSTLVETTVLSAKISFSFYLRQ